MKSHLLAPALLACLLMAACSKHSDVSNNINNTPTDSMPAGGYKTGWQSVLGGTGNDNANKVVQGTDGNYLAVGSTQSSNTGEVGHNHGGVDIWVVKFDANGDTLWTKTLGDTGNDYGTCAAATTDGGFVVGGYTTFTGTTNDTLGKIDGWIGKFSSTGQLLWSKSLGTTWSDYINSIVGTPDGGYAFAGESDGLKTGRGLDLWLEKVDSNGNFLWNKSIGGTGDDFGNGLTVAKDSGFLMTGHSNSNNGDFSASPFYGTIDMCVVKTDANGNVTWAKNLGGSNNDGGQSIAATTDGGCVAAGYTFSQNSGLVGNTNGNYDAWLVKLNAGGDTVWTRALGGASYDEALNIITTSYGGGYALAGYTFSNNSGDVGTNHGRSDVWVVELDSARHIMYQRTLGGTNYDPYSVGASLIRQKGGGGFIVATDSYSTDGDLQGLIKPNHNVDNVWLFQLH